MIQLIVNVLKFLSRKFLTRKVRMDLANKLLKNSGVRPSGFYPCSPSLIPAIVKSYRYLEEENLIENSGYYEFGVFRGYSIWFCQQISKPSTEMSFYGFDSFEGLPKIEDVDKNGGFYKGDYSASYEEVKKYLSENDVNFENLHLYKGFFSEEHFDKLVKSEKFRIPSIILVDCDLYSSTVPVLNLMSQLITKKCILLFDDFNCYNRDDSKGQRRAFLEFKKHNEHLEFTSFLEFGWHGEAFLVSPKNASRGNGI